MVLTFRIVLLDQDHLRELRGHQRHPDLADPFGRLFIHAANQLVEVDLAGIPVETQFDDDFTVHVVHALTDC
jgi:hypothetical protein